MTLLIIYYYALTIFPTCVIYNKSARFELALIDVELHSCFSWFYHIPYWVRITICRRSFVNRTSLNLESCKARYKFYPKITMNIIVMLRCMLIIENIKYFVLTEYICISCAEFLVVKLVRTMPNLSNLAKMNFANRSHIIVNFANYIL